MGFARSLDVRVSVIVPQAELYFVWACCTPAHIRVKSSVGCAVPNAGKFRKKSIKAALVHAVLISTLEKAESQRPNADPYGIADWLHLRTSASVFVYCR